MTEEKKKLNIEFPTLDLKGDVLRIADTISKFGGSLSKKDIQEHLKIPFGSLGGPISSAKRYGLIKNEEGTKNLCLTKLGVQLSRAKTEEEKKLYLGKAFLKVPEFKYLVSNKNFTEMPQLSILKKILSTDRKVPDKYAGRLANLFRNNLDYLGIDISSLKNIDNRVISAKEDIETLEENNGDSSDFFEGVKLGFKLSKLSKDKSSKEKIKTILGDLIKETSNYPQLRTMFLQVNDMLDKGYLEPFKAVEYLDDKISEILGINNNVNTQTGPVAEEPKPNLSSEVSRDNSEIAS